MAHFTLASAAQMVLRTGRNISVEPANGTLSGVVFTREDGTVLTLMHRMQDGDHMTGTVTLPSSANGEPIDGLFSPVQAHDLVADFLAGYPMTYQEPPYLDEELRQLGA